MFLTDRLPITTKREYTDEGFLKVPARIARVGIQVYTASEMGLKDRDPKAMVRVYRPEEEVFSDESLKSFTNKPVTNNHPPVLVDTSNAKQFSVGMSGPEVTKDGIYAETILNVTDGKAIKDIESGKSELSNGYTADIELTAGVTPGGETYDVIQRNIKGNHIAIVTRGRAGPACRVADELPETGDIVTMAKITIDSVDFEVPEQAGQAVGKLQVSLSDAEKEIEKKEEELKDKEEKEEAKDKEAKKTEDSLNAKIDDLTSKIPSAKTLDALVVERTKAIDECLKVAPGIKWEGKDTAELRKEAVALACPTMDLESKSADYIDARFDMLVESAAGTDSNVTSISDALSTQVKSKTPVKDVDTRPADVIARENFIAESPSAWKSGGAK